MLKFIDHRANKAGNVEIVASGIENIPKENGFIFYPNHQGMYDALAIMEVSPLPFSVVAKKEVANIPFLKQIFSCVKAKMMDRKDIRQSLQVIMQVAKEVKEGRIILFFRREPDRKTEIQSENLKEEALRLLQKQNVRSFRWR